MAYGCIIIMTCLCNVLVSIYTPGLRDCESHCVSYVSCTDHNTFTLSNTYRVRVGLEKPEKPGNSCLKNSCFPNILKTTGKHEKDIERSWIVMEFYMYMYKLKIV